LVAVDERIICAGLVGVILLDDEDERCWVGPRQSRANQQQEVRVTESRQQIEPTFIREAKSTSIAARLFMTLILQIYQLNLESLAI